MQSLSNTQCDFNIGATGSSAAGRGGDEEGSSVGSSPEDSTATRNRWWCSSTYMACVREWLCFLTTLLLTHLDERSCGPLCLATMTAALKPFPPTTPSFIHPSLSSIAPPSSRLHRGECVWDGVAVGLTGKQRFSPASISSSLLSGAERYETISWQAVFSLSFSPTG